MILLKIASSLTKYVATQKHDGKKIGFVPTMGALHEGHFSLIRQAKRENDITVCSIFVNPTQFNNAEDFKKYPITVEKDIEQLIALDCDVLFLPSAVEIYPPNYVAKHYDLGELETVLEGKYRPGHFQGVCQVVDRLLGIVDPNVIYLGQKDYQQCQVIQRLLQLTDRPGMDLRISPTVREKNGLAMSSRNMRLNEAQREKAPALYEELNETKNLLGIKPFQEIKDAATQHLVSKGFKVDYFEIANTKTLAPARDSSQPVLALVAAYLDDIRLIDNLPLN